MEGKEEGRKESGHKWSKRREGGIETTFGGETCRGGDNMWKERGGTEADGT